MTRPASPSCSPTTSTFADAVAGAVDRQLGQPLDRRTRHDELGGERRDHHRARACRCAMPLVDRLAPEHLELAVDDPQPLFDAVRHAGSVFMGRMTPEAMGDYVAGPNHVLPTGRRARFSSGLSVLDFMKRTSVIRLDARLAGPARAGGRGAGRGGRAARACRQRGEEARNIMTDRSKTRSAARLAAVQALYQMEMEATPLATLLHEFHQHRLGATIEDVTYHPAEEPFFDDVVSGVDARREEIDGLIGEQAAPAAGRWSASTSRCGRSCARALMSCSRAPTCPTGSVISEYVDVAHAFYDKREAGFVNGLLDAIAKAVRS